MAVKRGTGNDRLQPDDRPAIHRPVIEAEGDLRPKNQITVPKVVAEAMGLQPGDRLIFIVDAEGSDHTRMYRVPKSFAGIAPHAYGGSSGTKKYLRGERESWDE